MLPAARCAAGRQLCWKEARMGCMSCNPFCGKCRPPHPKPVVCESCGKLVMRGRYEKWACPAAAPPCLPASGFVAIGRAFYATFPACTMCARIRRARSIPADGRTATISIKADSGRGSLGFGNVGPLIHDSEKVVKEETCVAIVQVDSIVGFDLVEPIHHGIAMHVQKLGRLLHAAVEIEVDL